MLPWAYWSPGTEVIKLVLWSIHSNSNTLNAKHSVFNVQNGQISWLGISVYQITYSYNSYTHKIYKILVSHHITSSSLSNFSFWALHPSIKRLSIKIIIYLCAQKIHDREFMLTFTNVTCALYMWAETDVKEKYTYIDIIMILQPYPAFRFLFFVSWNKLIFWVARKTIQFISMK